MATKSADAFRTISEAAEQLDLPQHVLRHWEDVFGHIRPMRRAGGRRYYRTYDLELLNGVRTLLYDERYTTKGVQKIFKENGPQYVAEIGRRAKNGEPQASRDGDPEDGEIEKLSITPKPAAPVVTEGPVAPAPDIAPHVAEKISTLAERLDRIQDSLDEALLAIDGIAASFED